MSNVIYITGETKPDALYTALADMVNDAVALLRLGQRVVEGIWLRLAGNVDGLAHFQIPHDVCTLRAKIHKRDNL
jgi:hypothetical protein